MGGAHHGAVAIVGVAVQQNGLRAVHLHQCRTHCLLNHGCLRTKEHCWFLRQAANCSDTCDKAQEDSCRRLLCPGLGFDWDAGLSVEIHLIFQSSSLWILSRFRSSHPAPGAAAHCLVCWRKGPARRADMSYDEASCSRSCHARLSKGCKDRGKRFCPLWSRIRSHLLRPMASTSPCAWNQSWMKTVFSASYCMATLQLPVNHFHTYRSCFSGSQSELGSQCTPCKASFAVLCRRTQRCILTFRRVHT